LNNKHYVKVLVDIEHMSLDQTFDYKVPNDLTHTIDLGQRVLIPFSNRLITGFITEFVKTPSYETSQLKAIEDIIDIIPYFDKERLNLASFLAKKHLRPTVKYLNAMLPSALSMKYKTVFKPLKKSLKNDLQTIFNHKQQVDKASLNSKALHVIKQGVQEGSVDMMHQFNQATKIKTTPYLILKKAVHVRGPKQKAVIEYLREHGVSKMQTVLNHVDTSSQTLKPLIKRGLIEKHSKETLRTIKAYIEEPDKTVVLNETQSKIKTQILKTLTTPQEHLIYGVTGSGKTEIYIELIKAVRKHGKQALVLLPEIALTPKIVARFKKAFDEPIAIYHSSLSKGEQYDQWRQVLKQEVHICIGARSAAFMPFDQLGIIIMDEEQSDAYVQRDNPPYHTQEVLRLRSHHHNAPIVYGSATPSVETYYQAKKGTITLHTIKKRALNATMPKIELINMKQEFKQGNGSIFSKPLQQKIQETLDKKEQIMILINRRGHNNFVICRECGKRIKCPKCDISLTYHKNTQALKCHYCNHTEPSPSNCPSCQSPHIRFMGVGTQQVETQLHRSFKAAKVYRMDYDTTTKKSAHEKLIAAFEKDGDILVGTQMITKGLDFENVTLVAVLSADMALFVPDFYAQSETFTQLTQIAGRSGRRKKQGYVLIQAYDSDHSILKDVKAQSYESFYAREIAFRKRARVEPFYKITQMLFLYKTYEVAYKKALEVKRYMMSLSDVNILGPSDPKINKQNNIYRVQLIIRHHDDGVIHDLLHKVHTYFKDGVSIQINHYPKIM